MNWDFREPAEERAALLAEFTAKESDAMRESPKREPAVLVSGTDVGVVNWKFGPK